MPLAESHKQLTDREIALLIRWIEEGGQWQDHWAFEPVSVVDVPKTVESDRVRNPIDAFVLRRLDAEELKPSAEASKSVLIRRLSLDITGLPPSREATEEFIADDAPGAYESLVDRLLASKHYGEHQARYWLDVARYADTHGLHFDNYRSMWPYRDWVIKAFNDNKPFDEFTIEQLAGDLLPKGEPDQIIATGFSRANPTTSEGGAIDKEYEAIYAKDRVETMAAAWLGLTVGCASCHDHKFDPITQEDFYRLTAFFRNTTEKAMDGNNFDTLPTFRVLADHDYDRLDQIQAELYEIESELNRVKRNSRQSFEAWRANGADTPQWPPEQVRERQVFEAPLDEGRGDRISISGVPSSSTANVAGEFRWFHSGQKAALQANESTLVEIGDVANFGLDDAFSVGFELYVPSHDSTNKTYRLVDGSFVLFGRYNEDKHGWSVFVSDGLGVGLDIAVPDEYSRWLPGYTLFRGGAMAFELSGDENPRTTFIDTDKWYHVVINYDGLGFSDSIKVYVNGHLSDGWVRSIDLAAVDSYRSDNQPFIIGNGVGVVADSVEHTGNSVFFRELEIYDGVLDEADVRSWYVTSNVNGANHVDSNDSLFYEYYLHNILHESSALLARKRTLKEELIGLYRDSTPTLVMEEKVNATPEAHILIRGEYDNEGDKVSANVPEFLPDLPAGDANRLALARWLVRPDHPLTARVTVNRIWQSIFGRGLVATAADFGSQGVPPTHPELLDWLTRQFVENGWDVKQLIKLIVMSSTYRQSSTIDPELIELDPENQLLARGARYRLDAEVIRDQALFLSGLLDTTVGGRPVKPYQPDGVWKAVAHVGSNTERFEKDSGAKLYRRSIYTFVKRTAMSPSMSIFDAPSRQGTAPVRERTNSPLQALVLMNDEQFIEAAKMLAQRIMQGSEDEIESLIGLVLSRSPTDPERAILQNTYDVAHETYSADADAAKALISAGDFETDPSSDVSKLAAWTVVANQLLNLDETITRH